MAYTAPLPATYPQGVISIRVQNQTLDSPVTDAATNNAAIAARPGDTIRYIVQVQNKKHVGNNTDLIQTIVTSNLAASINLKSDTKQRKIQSNFGTIATGKTVSRDFTLTIAPEAAGIVATAACFTGDSPAHNAPGHGCDTAYIKITKSATNGLPTTGVQASTLFIIFTVTTMSGYIMRRLQLRFKRLV